MAARHIEGRVMPAPWFRAQAVAKPIIEAAFGEPDRALREGERRLGRYILPPFQRPPVWTREQQVRLIESIWNALPIGSFVYNQTSLDQPCDGWLLDGQQRITALVAYVSGDFPVYGWRFPDLPLMEQRGFKMQPIGALETNLTNEAACREVYDRLAFGGTPHEPKA